MPKLSNIAVRRYGGVGPYVHVLHGGPGAPGSARGLAEALAGSFRVHEPLQRRSGEVPLTVARHVADLDAVIAERTLLVGWSWGAMLALSYAAAHPERVRGVALVGCGTYDTQSRIEYQRAMNERLTPADRSEIERLERAMAEAATVGDRDALFAQVGVIFSRAQSVGLDNADESDLQPDAAGYSETWDDVVHLQATGAEPQSFAAITAPVALFQGKHDPHPGPMIHACLHEHIPQLAYVEVPGSGHMPWKERIARAGFLTELTAWLSEIPCPG